MADIEWNPGLSIGVDSIDHEHQQLIGYANALVHGVRGADAKAVAKAFQELRKYTVIHFGNEEEYMQQIHYPSLNAHRQQHSDLKHQVKIYQDTLYRRGDITEHEVVEFLKHWLIDHVLHTDMEIKHFLAGKTAG